MLDVAPFIIGASTYVPLRFVSQALGASVNYDASNRARRAHQRRSVSRAAAATRAGRATRAAAGARAQNSSSNSRSSGRKSSNSSSNSRSSGRKSSNSSSNSRSSSRQQQQQQQQLAQQRMQEQQQQPSPLTLAAVHPGRDESVAARRPTIEADFGNAQADPNSVRVTLDGLNVTDEASRSQRGVVFSPSSDLQSGRHDVRIAGTDTNGRPFSGSWTFASGTSIVSNTITNLRPGDGAGVHEQFTVSGRTRPGARVVVQVGTVGRPRNDNVLGALFGGGNGNGNGNDSVRSEVTADGNGNFAAPITIQARSGQPLTLVVDSTDAQTKTAAPRIVRSLTVE